MDITISVTSPQATAFQEAVAYWNEKNEQTLTAKQMVKRFARIFYRDTIRAKRNEPHQSTVENEIDSTWSE